MLTVPGGCPNDMRSDSLVSVDLEAAWLTGQIIAVDGGQTARI